MNDVPYFYDHEGRRIQVGESINAVHYLWDEFSTYGDVILESNYAYDYSRHYTLANGMLLSHSQIIANQSVPSYYLSDAQGSTRALANLSGTITDSYTYDAFGTLSEHLNLGIGGNLVPNEDGIFGTHYLYTGQQFDPNTDLYSLRARYYNPSLGRFLSRDTWAYNYQNPYELNRYVYTSNNPVKYTDPSGYAATLARGATHQVSFGGGKTPNNKILGAVIGGIVGGVAGAVVAAIRLSLAASGACGERVQQAAIHHPGLLIGLSATMGAAFGAFVGYHSVEIAKFMMFSESVNIAAVQALSSLGIASFEYFITGGESLPCFMFDAMLSIVGFGLMGGGAGPNTLNGGEVLAYNPAMAIDYAIGNVLVGAGTWGGQDFAFSNTAPEGGWTDWSAPTSPLPEDSTGPVHHIATDKHQYSGIFRQIFDDAGLDVSDSEWNLVRLNGHKGRHSATYHSYILGELRDALDGEIPFTNAYRHALQERLYAIRIDLLSKGSYVRSLLGLQ